MQLHVPRVKEHGKQPAGHKGMHVQFKKKKKKKKKKLPRGGSFSEHLAIESMGGRHTPIPLQFDAHGLKMSFISLRT